jgi:superfamily II DNA or RNA helicase
MDNAQATRQGFSSDANEHQLSAILATDGPLLIIAGPGSGKTFTSLNVSFT